MLGASDSTSKTSRAITGTSNEGEEVDTDLELLMSTAHLGFNSGARAVDRKNKKGVLEWDEGMEAMQREKLAAEAMRGK